MTSGNVSDEPIAFGDEDALERLGGDRRPVPRPRPADRDADRRLGRRAVAGRAPAMLAAPLARVRARRACRCPSGAARPMLACGAELKNTFCVAKGEPRLGLPPHRRPARTTRRCARSPRGSSTSSGCSRSTPEVVAHDLHPEYLSTKYALERDGVELVGVQHHHAHLAACLAEHGVTGPGVGAIFDGTGYGTDGTVWGGELLVGDLADFAAAGSLLPVRLPGRRARDPRAVADGVRLARRRCGRDARTAAGARGTRRPGALGRRSRGWRERGMRSPLTIEHGPPVRRRRGAVRDPRRGQLRGPGGDRARGGVRSRRAGTYPIES